ncbi:MAG TPA: RagB/SusD family nutrient uptake outer membrane protein, partial [Saprospiraceae bacterium]|nr:RagB/SusD family nutrient uptake outer membrane protein [Saprospiraceae bacterium]
NPIVRYAEVLLNSAEANARTGNAAKGLELLNQVRNRSVTNTADQFTSSSFSSDNDLIAAILFERRIEFLGEGKRWPDLHRLAKNAGTGIPAKVAFGNTTKASWGFGLNYQDGQYTGTLKIVASPYDDFRFLWPIPQDELNTNEVLRAQQNPGY